MPKLISFELVMPSNHLILCHPLLLLPSIFPNIRAFSNKSALRIRWPKYWSFSFNISPSNEHSGLSSFRMDWLWLIGEKACLFLNLYLQTFIYYRLNIQKTKIMATDPITSWQIDRETVSDILFFWAPKSLQMVTAAMKLKDSCSLEGKLWPTWTAY